MVLENVPDAQKKKNRISYHVLKELGGEFVSDIIDVTRRNNGQVQRAADYFIGDKVVCKDFD